MTEPFKQWVIEDHFPNGRPAWEKFGAQMVADVLPYEKMKLRLLNASHQAMCYIGMLVGHTLAHETMEDPRIRKLVQTMMDVEVTPHPPAVPGIDLAEYKKTLIERFANPAIRDQLARIGTGLELRHQRQPDGNTDNEEEERKHEVCRRTAVPVGVFEPGVDMTPVASVVDQQHRRDGEAAQRIDGLQAASRFTHLRSR